MTLTVGGGAQTVNVQIKNTGDAPQVANVGLTIDIPGDLGLSISSKPSGCDGGGTHLSCTVTFSVTSPLGPGQTKNVPIGVSPPAQSSIPAGQQKSGGGQVIITDGGSDTKGFQATLKAQAAAPTTQAAPQTVTEVSGNITDSSTGKGIKGATVVLEDGAGKTRQTSTTNDAGAFKFTGTEQSPIAPGQLTLQAGATGFDNQNKTVTGTAGKANTGLKMGLPKLADTASPVAPPSAGDPAIVEGQSAGGVVPQNTKTNNASDDSGGGVSWILIALGVLLVGFGIVAIVMLLRRRGDDDDEDVEDEPAPRRGPGPRPAYAGQGPDPTMVAGMGGAPAMINRGNNDATAIVRPGRGGFDDVPPDPYGAPPLGAGGYPSAGGYDDRAGFASGGYNGGGGNGYGAQPGRPAPGPAVDPYAPDYNGGGGGYADSTQRYEPGTGGNGYGGGANGYNNNPPTGGYGPGAGPGGAGGQGGYGANGYDGPSTGGNNYGGGQRDRGGYEGPPTTLGGYDGPHAGGDRGGYGAPGGQGGGGGYDDRGGQGGGGGYDDRGGYGAAGGQGGPGGGYDDRGGYGPAAGGNGYEGPSAGGGYGPGGERGGYGPAAGGGYDGGQGGGYDDRGGYGPGGNGGGGDYDGPYAGRGGYEPQGPGRGYEPASGYERDGYERVPEPPRAGNGYGPGGGGQASGDYDQRGGYGPGNNGGGGDYDDARSQGRGGNGNRRSLDWLDD
ncbi:carboxypeptidase-like regulatory domain-containing protein [Dactylosporangium sp. NPDC051541]|uniref:carboxypeptidase-like regulatory domain-containing protein n=1 Tax=Dactylosporangium sp. NPDC051541 TaxID=3363977 RepID=UPI0037A9D3D1